MAPLSTFARLFTPHPCVGAALSITKLYYFIDSYLVFSLPWAIHRFFHSIRTSVTQTSDSFHGHVQGAEGTRLVCSLSLSLMFSSFLLFCLHLWLLSRLSHVCLLRIIHGLRRGHRGRSHDRGLVFGCVADGGVERHGVDAVFVGASRPWDRTSSAGTIYTRISPWLDTVDSAVAHDFRRVGRVRGGALGSRIVLVSWEI